jgi:hypothetical protein
MREAISNMSPQNAHQQVLEEVGGLVGVKYAGQLPSMKTLYQMSSDSRETRPFEALYERALSDEQDYKDEPTNYGRFIRGVTLFPEHYIMCLTDRQLSDMRRFLTPEVGAMIFNLDTTFKVVDSKTKKSYYATFGTYRHGCLLVTDGRNHPVLIGAVMFHQHPPSYALYYTFASNIKRMAGSKGMNIRFIGTDGDKVGIPLV